jgi:beta-galactosidase
MGEVAVGTGTAEVGSAYKGKGGAARPSKDGDWSESYMINLFDWHLREQEQMPSLTGSAQWIFKDFATPLRPENPVPRVNQKGVVERDGTPKESYYVYQSYWSDKPMVHIYGHTWPVRWGKPDEEKQVKVFSNCKDVELFVNGVSAGSRHRDITIFPASGLSWNVKLKEGDNILRAVGKNSGQDIIDEIHQEYQTNPWGKPAKITLREISRSNGTVTIEARVTDADGVDCLDAANLVRFGILGDASLIDNLGTSTGSRSLQLYNGRARISIQTSGPESIASVSSNGIDTAFLPIKNQK